MSISTNHITGTYNTPTQGSKQKSFDLIIKSNILIAITESGEPVKLNTKEPNITTYFEKIIKHIASKGQTGLPIGSTKEIAQPNTLEALLQTMSNLRLQGTYVAPILERHFGMEYFIPKGRRGVWIRKKHP